MYHSYSCIIHLTHIEWQQLCETRYRTFTFYPRSGGQGQWMGVPEVKASCAFCDVWAARRGLCVCKYNFLNPFSVSSFVDQ